MENFIEIEFANISHDTINILIAELSSQGFDGFEEEETTLKSFISESAFDEKGLVEIALRHHVQFNKTIIGARNWNSSWESNFQPVTVEQFVGIRAEFHPPLINVEHEIIITPKMSFGTGHHETTYMMISQMKTIEFSGKTVFDFGTGTGLLAILAEKLGANKVIAIDNDIWSIENASENISRNHCRRIELSNASEPPGKLQFDIILANINKHIILSNFSKIVDAIKPGGVILISGILPEDENDIFRNISAYSLQKLQTVVRGNWLCVKISC